LIKTLLDLETIMVDELIGRLKPSEEWINHNSSKTIASLNLIEDELLAHLSSSLKVSGNGDTDRPMESPSSTNKHGPRRGKGRGSGGCCGNYSGRNAGGHGSLNAGCGGGRTGGEVARDWCRYWGKHGHWAHKCRKKKRDEEVHATQAEEEDEPDSGAP
jgi:hypothetical protein